MRLASARADLNIMREASLEDGLAWNDRTEPAVLARAYPHGGMQRAGTLIVLLDSWTAAEYLGEPELPDGTFHVLDLSLGWSGSLDPLGRFPADTADHVGVGQGFWRLLNGLHVQSGGERLGDARVEG